MKEESSPKKNLIYNLIYQILILIIPFITAPYLSRTVGANGVGTYSYTYSIVYYFVIISMLGINNYGNREIAKNRGNKEKLSETFWGIYIIECITTIAMLILYIIYTIVFSNQYKDIALIQTIFIVASLFDVNWFFFGMEKFKSTITRNTIIKIITTVLIFVFVKNNNDIWKYTLIMSGMTFLSQIILWPILLKNINFMPIKKIEFKKHIKPCVVLFIPVIAISIYKLMDKIMIGAITDVNEVGYYENGEKIISICFSVVNAIGTVMLPRISNLLSTGDNNKIKEYISKSIKFTMFITFPMCFGLIAIADEFAIIYYGEQFIRSGIVMKLLAITVPVASWATIVRTQYLIPNEKDKEYLVSVCIGAIINVILNIIFIPKYGCIGACYGTIVSEIFVMIIQTNIARKSLNIGKYLKDSIPFLIKSICMFTIIYLFKYISVSAAVRIILQVLFGSVTYAILNARYIINTINFKKPKLV